MKKNLLLLLAIILTLAGIPVIHRIQTGLNDTIRERHLMPEQFSEEGGAPPGITFSTVFLGGFRSLVSNFLWMRMMRLQENGDYYELVQLADWI